MQGLAIAMMHDAAAGACARHTRSIVSIVRCCCCCAAARGAAALCHDDICSVRACSLALSLFIARTRQCRRLCLVPIVMLALPLFTGNRWRRATALKAGKRPSSQRGACLARHGVCP